MNKVDQRFINECDELIKIGKGKQVLEAIYKMPSRSIPRSYLSQVGSLLNRTGGSYHCLKLLHMYIRGTYYDLGSNLEKKEYAKALIEIGAQAEGLELIEDIPESTDPSTLLIKAFCHFKSWDYQKALPYVLKYTNLEKNDYQILVGKINLASVYINLKKYDLALKLLLELEIQTDKSSQKLLKGYILEQIGQIYYLTEKFDFAKEKLSESTNILKSSNQKALLYPKKWQALMDLQLNHNPNLINHVREQNQSFNDYETLRDLDYWQAKILNDESLMSKVYYNTPYSAFKNRIQSQLVSSKWNWYAQEKNSKNILNIFGQQLPFVFELTSRLFCHLLSDGYKPMTIGSIHSKLFPSEHFNPFSSPDRVYQVLSRLNKKLKINFSYKVEKMNNKYTIIPHNMKNFYYYIDKKNSGLLNQPELIFSNQIKNITNNKNFTAKELSLKYNVSSRTVNRWLKDLTESTRLIKVGSGKNTKYKFTG